MARKADGSIVIDTKIDDASLKKGISGIGTSLKGLTKLVAAAFSVKVVYNFSKACIQAASDLEEVQNVVDVVFGESSAIIDNFAKNAVKSLGLSELSAKRYASTMGAMLKSMKLSDKQVLVMSQNLTALAGDIASFYNLSGDEAFAKLRSGISGETEPLKQLGINLSVANMQAYALSQGITKSYNSMTQAEQALLRYNYLLSVTKDAQGDFSRTSGSWANQVKVLSEQWNTFKSVLGSSFIQVLTPVVRALNLIMEKLILAGQYFQRFIYMITGVKPETKSASVAVESLGDSLDDTTKKAKKTEKALRGLQGFDKLNVLDSGSGSDSDSDGGAAGMSVSDPYDFSDITTATDALDKSFDEIDKKIQKFVSNFDFSNLITAFTNLKTSIEPITKTLFEGLEWCFNNILVPLSKWTIEDLLPAFLNAVSGALTLLNPLLTSFMELGKWLWENFLQPIASFTGGVVVDVLNGIGDALTTIGNWASDNQSIIDKMVATFATFFGLWKLTEIMAFIQMSGGLIAAIGGITAALWGAITAKIADKAETIALTLLYAKDFVLSVAKGTAEIIKQIVQFGLLTGAKALDTIKTGALTVAETLWNACSSLGTIITTALGVALNVLCSPITLVILAIGALIAAGVLLWKNWDTIMDWASKLGSKLKSIFQSVGSFISDIFNGISNVFKGLINGVISGLNTFISGINKISFDVPDWVPVIGGKKFGFDIPKIKKFENGGVLYKETLGVMAEYDNARFNPEIVSKESEMAKVFDGVLSKWVSKINKGNGKMSGTLKLVDANGVALGKVLVDALDEYSEELGYNPI